MSLVERQRGTEREGVMERKRAKERVMVLLTEMRLFPVAINYMKCT